MAKLLSFASWNVEHFHGDPARVKRVVKLLKTRNPDVFALYEVKGKAVFDELMAAMPSHNFFITERTDESTMEIMVGVKKSLQAFITQRDEFKSKVPTLRPGTLATIRKNGEDYGFLFLHLKSFPDPRSWGLRDDMFKHAASLKRKLDKNLGGSKTAKFLVLGDLNTMGLNAAYNATSDLDADGEIASLEKRMKAAGMRLLDKTHPFSWWNGSEKFKPGSKLDHVFVDNALSFKSFSNGAEIEVIGWPEESSDAKKRAWIEKFSDHGMLYGEIHT